MAARCQSRRATQGGGSFFRPTHPPLRPLIKNSCNFFGAVGVVEACSASMSALLPVRHEAELWSFDSRNTMVPPVGFTKASAEPHRVDG